MSKLVWDAVGEKVFETGVSNGVLYPIGESGTYPEGVAWNGLVSVSESPSGGEPSPVYADNSKYVEMMSLEEFGATIEAYTYPDEFAECDGSPTLVAGAKIGQQTRKTFGLAYKTLIGNDVDGTEYGYKLHLVYGAKAAPSEKAFSTVNESPEAITFSWDLTTTPVPVTGFKPTASLEIDSTTADATKLAALEDILFGTTEVDARLPLPDEIKTLLTPV
ncbi:MAG: hypothetical protein PHX43_03825 [Alphaproteobacteria bacterium]|nr:hypothetical protein [Alphaproteobacteria bacterium]